MIKVSALSDVGNRYTVNEDEIGWNKPKGLYFIADGMGGHAGGDVASDIVSRELLSASGSLIDSIMQAHRSICTAAQADSSLQGMGSTVVASKIQFDQCELGWVGDSRAYLWRSGGLRQLTEDHSLVQAMLNSGEITPDQARNHQYKHVILQTLGVDTPIPSRLIFELVPGDWLLLCSDGLTDELSDTEISDILKTSRNAAEAESALVSAALAKIGRDNISVMILRYQKYNWRVLAFYVAAGLGVAVLAFLLIQGRFLL